MSDPISTILLSVGANLITPSFETVKGKLSDPIQQAFVKSKLDALAASAFVKMEVYLRNEVRGKDAEEKIRRLIAEAGVISVQLAKSTRAIVAASFDAERAVTNYIAKNGYPTAIQEDQTTTPFNHLLTLTTTLMLELPDLMIDWEKESWIISFEALDQLSSTLTQQTERVLEVSEDISTLVEGKLPIDKAMTLLKGALRQAKARTQVEMTGLTPSQALSVQLKAIFVCPALRKYSESQTKKEETLESENNVVSELTATNKVFRITGPAGSGKTTLLRWLEQWHWTSSLRLAVRCDLRVISKSKNLPSLLQLFINSVPAGLRGTLTQEDFSRWLNVGSCLVIFDGFDEVSVTRRDVVLEWIQSCIAGAPSGNSFIISSRTLTTNHLSDEVWKIDKWSIKPIWQISGFDKQRVEKYIEKWQEHMLSPQEKEELETEDLPKSLAKTFSRAETIRELTSNPLLLSTLMIVHRLQGKKLPKGRSDLYRVYIDGMLGPWYEKKANSKEGIYLESSQMRRLLKLLALEMQTTEVSSIAETKAASLISKNKGNLKFSGPKILEHMLERTGLLIGPGEYQFAHKSIGEFLVAEAVISENFRNKSGDNIDRLHLLNHAAEDSWRVVLFLWVGLLQSLNDLKGFCNSLVSKQSAQIAIGLIEERADDLLLDQPDTLREIIIGVCSISPEDMAPIATKEDTGHYIGARSLPHSFYRGQYDVPSNGYLTISGIEHFNGRAFQNAVEAGLLNPSDFKNMGFSNSYYFELWTIWIQIGLDFSELMNLAPACLSRYQAMHAIAQYRKLISTVDIVDNDIADFVFVPLVVDWVLQETSETFLSRSMNNDEIDHLSKLQQYLSIKPISDWPDEWILAKLKDGVEGVSKRNWADNAPFKRSRISTNRDAEALLRSYQSRVLKLGDIENAPSLDSLWVKGIETKLEAEVNASNKSLGSLLKQGS